MKNKEVSLKNEKDEAADATVTAPPNTRPEPGAESQLHNYNVMLTRLGDLFGEDVEPKPPPVNNPGTPL